MPLPNLLPARDSVATPAPGRDRAIDVARLSALVTVMFGHCALLLATIDEGGLRIGNILGELPHLAPITWAVQVMPLFFFAGGAAGAYGWHPDGSASGKTWGSWLVGRTQRLCRPVFWYLAFWTAALLVARLTLGAESADRLGRECVALLWFLGVYLLVIAFVPALTRLRRPGGVAAVTAALVVAAALIDQIEDEHIAAVFIENIADNQAKFRVIDSILSVGRTSAPILLLLVTAALYSRTLAMTGLANAIESLFIGSGMDPWMVISVMVIIWFLLGMIIDSISIMLLTAAIFSPIAEKLGYDPIAFAIIGIIAIEAGLLTPPFGLLVYTVKSAIEGIDPDMSVMTIFISSTPYWMVMLLGMVLIINFPVIATFLPRLLF